MEERYGWFKRPGPNVLRGPVVSITLTIFEQSWKLQKCHNLESSNIGLDGSKDFAQMSWSGRWYAVGITLVIFEQGWKLQNCHNFESGMDGSKDSAQMSWGSRWWALRRLRFGVWSLFLEAVLPSHCVDLEENATCMQYCIKTLTQCGTHSWKHQLWN